LLSQFLESLARWRVYRNESPAGFAGCREDPQAEIDGVPGERELFAATKSRIQCEIELRLAVGTDLLDLLAKSFLLIVLKEADPRGIFFVSRDAGDRISLDISDRYLLHVEPETFPRKVEIYSSIFAGVIEFAGIAPKTSFIALKCKESM
jgi:hypothetical protein